MHAAPQSSAAVRNGTIGQGADLTAEVTVFVTSVGASTLGDCLAHLNAQDVVARFELIENVRPIGAALQQMLDRCETSHFVQVDEDMLLDPDAIRRLHGWIHDAWHQVAIVVGQLDDPHLGRPIEGVKISRHDIVKRFPWHGHASVIDRNTAMKEAGYLIARRPLADSTEKMTYGSHVLDRSRGAIFGRYRRLEELRLAHPLELTWFAEFEQEFERRLGERYDAADDEALRGIHAARSATASSGSVP